MKRFKLNYIMLMVCASAILATACKDETKDPSLSVATATLNYAYGGGSQDVTLDTDFTNWSARPDVEWIKITMGDGRFTATAEPNDPGRKRTGKIVVAAGRMRHEIEVSQGGNILSLSAAKLDFEALPEEGQTSIDPKEVTVEVINKPWTATKAKNSAGNEPAWFDFTQNGDKLSVTVVENPWPAVAREGKIYVQMDAYKDSVIIAQARAPRPFEYDAEIKYAGRLIDANEVEFALADVILKGREVDSARVALVPGHVGSDIEEIALEIADGAIPSIPLKADGTVQIKTSGAGDYTFVVITFCKDGILQDNAFDEFVLAELGGGGIPTIDDFIGDYIMTGTCLYGPSYNANMSVNIAAGTEPNSLIITGIDFTESVNAIFNPEDGTMSIEPQDLADYYDDYYDETLTDAIFLTLLPDYDDSETAIMTFRRLSSGVLMLTPTSEAIGYVIYGINEDGEYVDSDVQINLVFTPSVAETASAKMSIPKSKEKYKFGKR